MRQCEKCDARGMRGPAPGMAEGTRPHLHSLGAVYTVYILLVGQLAREFVARPTVDLLYDPFGVLDELLFCYPSEVKISTAHDMGLEPLIDR